MATERWYERLEAYLDGELDRSERAAFETETAADPALQAELEARGAFREQSRRALAGAAGLPDDLADDLADLARGRGRQTTPTRPRRLQDRWPVLALAAVLLLAILAPTVLRNDHGAAGPRSITTAGPVTAVRFGEEPGAIAVLEAGCYDLAAGSCR